MTVEQYEVILGVLADKLKDNAETIGYQKIRIDLLEEKIKEAESLKDGGNKTAKLEIR